MKESETHLRLKAFIRRHGSQASAGRSLGVGRAFIGQMLRRERPIPAWILERLGIAKEVTYRETHS